MIYAILKFRMQFYRVAPGRSRALPYILGMYRELWLFSPLFLAFFSVGHSVLQVLRRSIFQRRRKGRRNQFELHCGSEAIRARVFCLALKCSCETGNLFMYRRWCYPFNGDMQMARSEGSVNRICFLCVGSYMVH